MTFAQTFQTPLVDLLLDVGFGQDFLSTIGVDQVLVHGYRRADVVGLADRIQEQGVGGALGGLNELGTAHAEIGQWAYWSFDVVLAPEAEIEIGVEGLGDVALVIRELGHVDVMLAAPRSFLRLTTGKLRIRLPADFLKPVSKGFKVTSETIRRLRRTDLPEPTVDSLQQTLLDQSFDSEGALRAAIDAAFGSAQHDDRLYARLANHFVDWVEEEGAREILIDFEVELYIDTFFNIHVRFPLLSDGVTPKVSLPPVMLGDTGFVLEADDVQLRFAGEDRGLYFDKAALYLPKDLPAAPDLAIIDCAITERGFSGRVAASWDLTVNRDQAGNPILEGELAGEIFGLQGGLASVALEFRESMPISSDITGKLVIPYFEEAEAIDVRLDLQVNGDFLLQLRAADKDGVMLRKEELLLLQMKSLSVAKRQMTGEVVVSGGIEPLLLASDGLSWPRLDVDELTISQNLANLNELPVLKFKEAWLDLRTLATVDLFGFQFDLNRVGLGYMEAEDKLWIDLTGNIRLIDQLPIGVGVEGFRITWPRRLYKELQIARPGDIDFATIIKIASRIEVRFDGVYLYYGVPQAVEFEGYIRFIKEAQKVGFAGDMVLRVPTTGLAIEAGLMIGINFEDPPYPFLYVYFGILLPSGIPLGQSGLALKGAKGMFGLNVTPDKTPEQNWYFDWYKRGPIEGAHPTSKWTDSRLAIALGAGVTITTTDGKILGVQGLLVIALPGPFLMIEGKALVFDGVLPIEPPLKALAVFDGRELTAQINIEAGAELIEDMLEASGVFEAFFDFRNLTNWHIYLGQDQPVDRRVKALVLKLLDGFLFKADAYLMVDMPSGDAVSSRLGVFIGVAPAIPPLGPVRVTVQATLEGLAEIRIPPINASAELTLDADLEVTAFGFGLMATARGSAMAAAPSPFEVVAKFKASIELPLPLQEVEDIPIVGDVLAFVEDSVGLPPEQLVDIDVEWSWSHQPASLEIDSPVDRQALSLESPIVQAAVPVEMVGGAQSDAASRKLARRSPRVALDDRLTLTFDHPMNVNPAMLAPIAGHPDGAVSRYQQSIVRFKPTLARIRLDARPKAESWESDWTEIASSDIALDPEGNLPPPGIMPLFGIWRAEPDSETPSRPSRRKLRLWSHHPFATALGRGHYQVAFGALDQVVGALGANPGLFLATADQPADICLDFADLLPKKVDKLPVEIETPATLSGARLASEGRLALVELDGEICLSSEAGLAISLPARAVEIEIKGCRTRPRQIVCLQLDYEVEGKSAAGRKPTVMERRQIVGHRVIKEDASLVRIRAEQGIDRIIIRDKAACLCRLCFRTVEDEACAATARSQRGDNDELLTGGYLGLEPLLRPGHYYRLRIETEVEADIDLNAIPFEPGSFLHDQAVLFGERVLQAYFQSSSQPTARDFIDEAFFQTDGPPAELERYVKWTAPVLGHSPVFRDADLSLRFRRSYVKALFAHEAHQLRFTVQTVDGVRLPGWQARWQKAGSATLLPDEQRWLDHLAVDPAYGEIEAALGQDDVVTLSRCEPTALDFKPDGAGWEIVELTPGLASLWRIEQDPRPARILPGQPLLPRLVQRQPTRSIAIARDTESSAFTYQAVLETGAPQAFGLVFHFVDPDHYWLFTLEPKAKRQRLTRVRDGASEAVLERRHAVALETSHRVRIQVERQDDGGSAIVIELDGKLWGRHPLPADAPSSGRVGLFVSGNNDARFAVLNLTRCPVLLPKARYELVVSGGGGGTVLLGEPLDPAVLARHAGPSGDASASNWLPIDQVAPDSATGWTIDPHNRRLASRGSAPGRLLFALSAWPNLDMQAGIGGLMIGKRAGFILRQAVDGLALRVTLERLADTTHALELAMAGDSDRRLAREVIAASALAGANLILRVQALGSEIIIHLNDRPRIRFDLACQLPENTRRLGGIAGLHADQGGIGFVDLTIRHPVLLRYPFITSAFRSFADLVESGRDRVRSAAVSGPVPAALLTSAATAQTAFASSQWRLGLAEVDFRDGEIDRAAFEQRKQAARSAGAALDQAYNRLDRALARLVHQPLADHLEAILLHDGAARLGIQLRSPESLVPLSLVSATDGIDAYDHIGRTQLELLSAAAADPIACTILANTGGNQLLLLPAAGGALPAGDLRLRFTYRHDQGDAGAPVDHRYDRPVTAILSQGVDEVAELPLVETA